jgi:peptidoglycan/LPS O-acetylase OafA/YrhL
MYLALPVIFMLLGPTRSPRIALGFWLAAAILAWFFPTPTEVHVTDFAPCFIAGIVAYTLSGWSTKRLPGWLWMPFLVTMVGLFFILAQSIPEGFYNPPYEWVFCLALGLLIPLFHDSTFSVANSIAALIARYSYGIYLFHCIALWIGCSVLGGLPLSWQWVVSAVLIVVMSVAGYHLVEKPAIDIGARLTSSRKLPTAGNQSLATPRINPSA